MSDAPTQFTFADLIDAIDRYRQARDFGPPVAPLGEGREEFVRRHCVESRQKLNALAAAVAGDPARMNR